MAVKRTISTRLVMEGEKAYRDSIKQINREYRTLDSELKLVESTFKGQQNTLAALSDKHKALTDLIGKQTEKIKAEKTALSQMERLQSQYAKAADEARAKLDKLNAETDEATKETREYQEEVIKIQREIAKYEAAEKNAADKVELHTQKMNKAQVELNDLNGELSKNEKYLDEAKNSTDGCARSIDEYGKEVKEATGETEALGEKGARSVDALAEALAAAGVVATAKKIAEALADCGKAAIEFESAFAGVKKTVDASDAEYDRLSNSLKEMSARIPATTTELAGIMELAGQLGVRGTENLQKFTETVAALGVSTNLTNEDAATMLAQFANITGMDLGDIERLGSVIVALGNNFATTETDIVRLGQRLASAGTQLGMSESEIMAFAAALSSVGVNAEAGGTAFSKLMINMQTASQTGMEGKRQIDQMGHSLRDLEMLADSDSKAFKELANSYGMTSTELKNYMSSVSDLDAFAAVAGLTAEEFARAYGEDAAGSIMLFLDGLHKIEQEGGSAIVTLEEMGITEVRLRDSTMRASNATGLFSDALETANTAWAENTALAKEAGQRYGTTESKIQLFRNAVGNLKIAIGDQLNPAIRETVETGTDVVQWAENLVKTNPELTQLVIALVGASTAFIGVATAIAVVSKAWIALKPVLSGSPWMLAAAAIGGVTAALMLLSERSKIEPSEGISKLGEQADAIKQKVDAANLAYDDTVAKIDATAGAAERYIERLQELEGQASLTDKEQYEYARTLDQLKALIPDLNVELDEQTGLLKDGADAIRDQVAAWKEQQFAEAVQERHRELIEAQADAWVTLTEAENKKKQVDQELAEAERAREEALTRQKELLGENADALEKGFTSGTRNARAMKTEYNQLAVQLSGESREAYEAYGATVAEQDEKIRQLTTDAAALNDTIGVLEGTYNEAAVTAENFGKGVVAAADAVGANSQATNDYADASAAFVESAQAVQEELDALIEAYDASYEAAYASIDSSMSLFQDMSEKTEASMQDMIASLESQIVYMDTYAANLKRAAELGVDEGLLAKLMDGSQQSASILQAIVDDGGQNIGELNQKFGKVEEGKQTFAALIAQMETDFLASMTSMKGGIDDLVTKFNQSGAAQTNMAATVNAAISELQSGEAQLNAIAARIQATLSEIGQASATAMTATRTSHAAGAEYIPYDEYPALLHKGEMVLTALQAKAYRAERYAGYGMAGQIGDIINNNSNTSTSLGGITIYVQGAEGSDGTAREIAEKVRRELRYKGVVR